MNYYVTMEKDNFWAREIKKRGFEILSFIECITGKMHLRFTQDDILMIIASKKTMILYKVIRILYPKAKIVCWYWDSLETGYPPKTSFYEKDKNTILFSFDKKDCERTGMNYNTQFYCDNLFADYASDQKEIVDVFFVGSDKGRYLEIMEIKNQLEKLGLSCDFRVVKDKTSTDLENRTYAQGMAYRKVIRRCTESRAILDFCQYGQSGLSLRAMESLFLSVKLITTNTDIEHYDFYHPDNIYILGANRADSLDEFMSRPYVEIDTEIKANYDFNQWYARIEQIVK